MPNPYQDDFDRSTRRSVGLMVALMVLWLTFLVGAVSTLIWLAGRALSVW